jgi:glycerol uptake facilitator-like aquaporin
VGYAIAQLLGACLGALPLLAWGSMGRSVAFGATIPGRGYSTAAVVMGEAVTTFALVTTLCVFLGFRRLRGYTPFVIPCLYAIMVPLEAPISGTTGWAPSSARWLRSFCAAPSPGASKWPSSITSRATADGCFTGWPTPGRRTAVTVDPGACERANFGAMFPWAFAVS